MEDDKKIDACASSSSSILSFDSATLNYLSVNEQNELLHQLNTLLSVALALMGMLGVFQLAMAIFFFFLFIFQMPPVHVEQVVGRDWLGRRLVSPESESLLSQASSNHTASILSYLKALEEQMTEKNTNKHNGSQHVLQQVKKAEREAFTSLEAVKDVAGRKTYLVSASGRAILLMTVMLLLCGAWNTFRAYFSLRIPVERLEKSSIRYLSSSVGDATTSSSYDLDLKKTLDSVNSTPSLPQERTSSIPREGILQRIFALAGLTKKETEEELRAPWQATIYGQAVLRLPRFLASFSLWSSAYWLLALQRYNRDNNARMVAAGLNPEMLYFGISSRPSDLLLALWQPFFQLLIVWMISSIASTRNDLIMLYGLRYDMNRQDK